LTPPYVLTGRFIVGSLPDVSVHLVTGQCVETFRLLPPIQVIGKRDKTGPPLMTALMNQSEPVGLLIGKRPNEKSIKNAEHGRIGSNANCHERHHNEAEARLLNEHAKGVFDVID